MREFFKGLFDTSRWPPRWHCGYWSDFHGWLYIISDLIIWAAYFIIPLIILHYVFTRTRLKLKFRKFYFFFAFFILLCGATHFLDAMMFWIPMYRFNALVSAVTAMTSAITGVLLIKELPFIFSQKTTKELENEIELRKRTEGQLQKTNTLLNHVSSLADVGGFEWIVETNTILFSNTAFSIYDIDENAEVKSEFLASFTHPDDRLLETAHNTKLFEEKTFEPYTFRIITARGNLKWIKTAGEVSLKADGSLDKVIGALVDITDLKKSEINLEQANESLQSFAYVASHDLQEPLRKITVFSSFLNESKTTSDNDKALISKITEAARRMQHLVNDVLALSVLSETINLEPVDPTLAIENAIHDLEMKISERNAIISYESTPMIYGHLPYLTHVFTNLISNGIKFSRNQPQIKITSEKSKDDVIIKISDNGIGIAGEHFKKIFEPFQRLHGRSEFAGSGIGLSIVNKIIKLHKAIIEVESEQEKGTTFILTFKSANAVNSSA